MNALRLTPEAKADLAEIRRFGIKRWGAKQARTYLSSMGVAFRRAADDPKLVPVADGVGSNYRRGRFGSHLFFFVEEPGVSPSCASFTSG